MVETLLLETFTTKLGKMLKSALKKILLWQVDWMISSIF